jgi:hypothetical protein
VRVGSAAVASAFLLAGCGSSAHSSEAQGTLAALWNRPGQQVAWTPGTSDFAPGPVRVSFLVIARNGRQIERPQARVWVARRLAAKPFAVTTARDERIGVPGIDEADEIAHTYVARFRVPAPGHYWLLAQPRGARVHALGDFVVKRRSVTPAVGARAFASRTPTLADVHGDAARLTTRVPPDLPLLRYSVAGSLAAHKPFVLVFATPKFCTSRTCGPAVDVALAVARRFRRSDIRFIHVEIYMDNDPAKGQNRFVRQWRLPSEPWVFLVGRDGRVKAKFEGPVSVGELAAAVRRNLS